jgi:hypothetical protein
LPTFGSLENAASLGLENAASLGNGTAAVRRSPVAQLWLVLLDLKAATDERE